MNLDDFFWVFGDHFEAKQLKQKNLTIALWEEF
jgi:hypothetical protein